MAEASPSEDHHIHAVREVVVGIAFVLADDLDESAVRHDMTTGYYHDSERAEIVLPGVCLVLADDEENLFGHLEIEVNLVEDQVIDSFHSLLFDHS